MVQCQCGAQGACHCICHVSHDMHMRRCLQRLLWTTESWCRPPRHARRHKIAVPQVDKLTANQKLDLNLERGRLRDDLQQLRDKLSTLRNSLEREVNLVRTDMESSKSDTLKWVVVTVVGLLGAGFAAIRLSIH